MGFGTYKARPPEPNGFAPALCGGCGFAVNFIRVRKCRDCGAEMCGYCKVKREGEVGPVCEDCDETHKAIESCKRGDRDP